MPRPTPKLTDPEAAEAVRRYPLGYSIREIELRLQRSDRAIRGALEAANIPIRDNGGFRATSPLVTPEVVATASRIVTERCLASGESFPAALSAYAWEIDVPRQALRSGFDSLPVVDQPKVHADDAAMRAETLRLIESWDRGERRLRSAPWPSCSSLV